jgi:mannose-6-phosphate isomerase
MNTSTYPLLLEPAYKDYLWGGHRIAEVFHRRVPPGLVAESWEVSDREDGVGIVRNGPLAGATFAEAIRQWGAGLLGSHVRGGRFPLLIKLIDARERLSVQVHPNDQTAALYGGEAKTECWYILDAAPGAGVYAGFRAGVDRAAYDKAVVDGVTGGLLRRIEVRRGDAVFIPGGLVHAIDAGCLILEVQQNSNTTYRIDDWGRVGPDGKPRALHVQQAAQVIRWDLADDPRVTPQTLPSEAGNRWSRLVESPYFLLDRVELEHPQPIDGRGETFVMLFVATGGARLDWPGGRLDLPPGTSCLVPANLAGVTVIPVTPSDVLRVTCP